MICMLYKAKYLFLQSAFEVEFILVLLVAVCSQKVFLHAVRRLFHRLWDTNVVFVWDFILV